MITIPRLQEFLCGVSLKNGSYIILTANLVLTFFGLVIVTAARVEEDVDESHLDVEYILYMVTSILLFLSIPMALYGTYRERTPFLIPYLGIKGVGIILFGTHIIIGILFLFGEEPTMSISLIVFLLGALLLVTYSFLVVFSYYTTLKQQREEIQ